jgi:hypothetical protein
MQRHLLHNVLLAAVVVCSGCQGADDARNVGSADSGENAEERAAAETAAPRASAGKPTAPISIEYDIIGAPIVGHPVNIDLAVRSTQGDRPVKLTYRVLDTGSLSFPESQVREVSVRVNQAQTAARQVTVVPQREGRLYLNVTAEVETESGAMIKSIAIPVQVGSGPGEREPAGEVTEDADGEAIISLPADEG